MPRPKKLDPIEAALLDAAEEAEAGIDTSHFSTTHSTELKDWRRNPQRKPAGVPTFDYPDVPPKG